MNAAVAWLALCAAIVAVPLPSPDRARVLALAGRPVRRSDAGTGPVRGSAAAHAPWRSVVGAVKTRQVGLVISAAAGVCGVSAVAVSGGLMLAFAAVVVMLTGWSLTDDAIGRTRRHRAESELLAAVCVLAAELQSGARPSAALAAAGDAAPHSRAVLATARSAASHGGDVAAVLLADAGLAAVGHAWRVADATGAPLADVLAGVAADCRDRAEQERQVQAALAAARSTAALLAALPVLGVGLGAAMGAHPLAYLLRAGSGRAVCCAGVLLDATGLLWTRRFSRRAESGSADLVQREGVP